MTFDREFATDIHIDQLRAENARAFEQAMVLLAEDVGLKPADLVANRSIIIDGIPLLLCVGSPVEPYTLLAIYSIGAPPPSQAAAAYLAMLQANLVAPAAFVTFAALPNSDEMVLSCRISIEPNGDLTGRQLKQQLSSFAHICHEQVRPDFT
jgi:hypothetical protein